jgi:hypothetical protein
MRFDHHPARRQRETDKGDADKLQDKPNDQPHRRFPNARTRRSVEQELAAAPMRAAHARGGSGKLPEPSSRLESVEKIGASAADVLM